MARVTMSSVSRLRDCQWWARDDARWVWTPSGPAAEFGTAVHEEVARAVEYANADKVAPLAHEDHAVAAVADSVVTWWQNQRDGHDSWHAEPAYVLDLDTMTASMVGTNIGRKYPRTTAMQVAGSADIVGLAYRQPVGVATDAVVIDVKTGRRENVDPADSNTQIATLALAVHLAHGVDTVRGVLAFPGSGGVATDEHTLDAYDLAAWGADLRGLLERVPTSQPQPTKKACQWCPAKAACPAMTEALATATPRTRLPVVMSAADIAGPDHAREQYLALRALKSGVDAAWGALRQYVDEHGPVDLGDGRAYGSRTTQRESIDLSTRAAVDALQRELGSTWEQAVTVETSKTAIKDAARDAAKVTGEKIAQVERRVLDALRSVGAVRQTTSTTYDETTTKDKVA